MRRRRLLGAALAALVVGAVFLFVLPQIADYRDVWEVLQGLGWADLAVLAAVTALNVLTFAPPWMVGLVALVVVLGAFTLALSSRRRALQVGNLVARLVTRVRGWFRRGAVSGE